MARTKQTARKTVATPQFEEVQPPFDYEVNTQAKNRKYQALKDCIPKVTLPIPAALSEEESKKLPRLGEDLMSRILLGACMLVHPLDLEDWLLSLLLISKDISALIKSKKFRQALRQIVRINEMLEDNFEASDYFNYMIVIENNPESTQDNFFTRSPSDSRVFFPGWNANGEIIIPQVLSTLESPPARKNPQLISQFHKMKQMVGNVLERNTTFSLMMQSQPAYWFPFFWQKIPLVLKLDHESMTEEEEIIEIDLEALKRFALNTNAKKAKPERQKETRSKDEQTTSLDEEQEEEEEEEKTYYRITNTKHEMFLDFMMQGVLYCMADNSKINSLPKTYPQMQFLADIFVDIFGDDNSKWATCDTNNSGNPFYFFMGDTPTAVIGLFFFAKN